MPVSIRRILCPVDFSTCSVRALQQAFAVSGWYGAAVAVMHVHGVPELPLMVDRDRLATELRTFVTTEAPAGCEVDCVLEEGDDVRRAILRRAAESKDDLIIMGTHGRSGFQHLLLGSIAERVIRTSETPVVVVPPGAATPKAGEIHGWRIVCATDFSDGSARALEYAAAFAAQTRAALTVAHIVEIPDDFGEDAAGDISDYRTARFERAQAPLLAAIEPLQRACHVTPLLLGGRPSTEILRLADEQQADLIVMGVHGRGAVDRMIFGSVTEHVVRRATCSVLTVRCDGSAAGGMLPTP
jgi:nucleotide-binding universal stress UspA family protein